MKKKKAKAKLVGPTKHAQLIADVVHVVSACGEPQPNKQDGSEQWMSENFRRSSGTYACVACDQKLLIAATPKVQFA